MAVFTSLGVSSGEAFVMDVVHDAPGALRALGAGFVLEPVKRLQPADVARALARTPGKRARVTVEGYCLEFLKPPPLKDVIYRLVPPRRDAKAGRLGLIMAASKLLLDKKALHADSDPKEYFHSIRQWALWTEEQGWKDADAFGTAFLAHAKKNYTAAGRPWAPEVERAIARIVPGRWRDITAVRAVADQLSRLKAR
jgi:hypothetical protein